MNFRVLKKSNLFWTSIGILGSLIVSLGGHIVSQKESEPLYSITKEPTLIYSKDDLSSKIKFIYNDSLLINKNVYISNVVIWNNGNLEIQKGDVRKDFIIGFIDTCNILDYRIINQIPTDFDNFNIISKRNILHLNWNHFDPNTGLEIQIIYSGDKKSLPVVEGSVLGREFKRVYSNKIKTTLNLGFFVFVTFIMFYLVYVFWREKNIYWKGKTLSIIHKVLITLITISLFYIEIKFYLFYFKLYEIPFN